MVVRDSGIGHVVPFTVNECLQVQFQLFEYMVTLLFMRTVLI